MKQILYIISLLFGYSFTLFANDGAFYTNGNQLIPIGETDISVEKEILTINRKNDRQVEVFVYYEFFNPQNTKNLTVGFEAMPPSGDAEISPKDGQHPYISEFVVEANNQILPYKVAMVDDSLYHKTGKVKGLNARQVSEKTYEGYAEYAYVYYFDVQFKKGVNIVKHTYTFDLSGGVMYNYEFNYILTAAKRWANKQINDFTLIINMGNFQDFYINNSFCKDANWTIAGIGNMSSKASYPFTWYESEKDKQTYSRFYMNKGSIVFHKKNFIPMDELFLQSIYFRPSTYKIFDYKEDIELPFTTEAYFESAEDNISRKILRNLPFAKRGYVFSTPELKKYYEGQQWYKPNPNYKSKMEDLTPEEQKWVNQWSD